MGLWKCRITTCRDWCRTDSSIARAISVHLLDPAIHFHHVTLKGRTKQLPQGCFLWFDLEPVHVRNERG